MLAQSRKAYMPQFNQKSVSQPLLSLQQLKCRYNNLKKKNIGNKIACVTAGLAWILLRIQRLTTVAHSRCKLAEKLTIFQFLLITHTPAMEIRKLSSHLENVSCCLATTLAEIILGSSSTKIESYCLLRVAADSLLSSNSWSPPRGLLYQLNCKWSRH